MEDSKFVAFGFSWYSSQANFLPTNYLSIWNNRVVMAYYSERKSWFSKKIEVCITTELFPLGMRHHYYHRWCIIFLNWWCHVYLSFVLQGVGCRIYMQSKLIWGIIFYFYILYFYLKVYQLEFTYIWKLWCESKLGDKDRKLIDIWNYTKGTCFFICSTFATFHLPFPMILMDQ